MPAITGQDAEFTVDGDMLGTLGEVEVNVEESKFIDQSTQGDDWDQELHVRTRWTVRGILELPLESYATYIALVAAGDPVDFAMKIEAGAGGNFFAGSVRPTRARLQVRVEDKVIQEFEGRGVGAPTTIN